MAKVIKTYELVPNDRHKSFYGKAVVREYDDGTAVLRSYKTDVASKVNGNLLRHWGDWSATTGRHLVAFAGINKAAWDKMEVVALDSKYKI